MPKFHHYDRLPRPTTENVHCFDVEYAIADEVLRQSNRLGRGLNQKEAAKIRKRLEGLDVVGHTLLPIFIDEVGASETEQAFTMQLTQNPQNFDSLQKMTEASKSLAQKLGFSKCQVAIHLSRTLPLTKESPFWGYTEQGYLYDVTITFGTEGQGAHSVMLTCQSFAPYHS